MLRLGPAGRRTDLVDHAFDNPAFLERAPIDLDHSITFSCGVPGRSAARRLRALGDSLDSLEGAEHVALVATLPQDPTERPPNLGEEVVAEIE